MSKFLKKIAPIALPILGTMIAPGVGTALGSSLSTAALGGIGGALGGAAGGAVSGGGLKGAALGAALGGAGGYMSGGGSILGEAAHTLPAGVSGPVSQGSGILGALTRGGSTIGTGVADVLSGASRVGSSLFGGGSSSGSPSVLRTLTGGGSTMFNGGITGAGTEAAGGTMGGSPLMSLLSGYQQYQTQDDIEKQLRHSQQQAMGVLDPYLQSGNDANAQLRGRLSAGFDSSSLESDPGYQFRLGQGQKQLEASLAARGMGQSGQALKAAQEYGQNFANNEYQDAYQRWLSQNQQLAGQGGQGANVAGSVGDIYGNIGTVGATGTAAKNNAITGTLASLYGNRRITGWDNMGNPIYG